MVFHVVNVDHLVSLDRFIIVLTNVGEALSNICHMMNAVVDVNWNRAARMNIDVTGMILGLCLANEKWRYFVTPYLIGWVQA